MAYEMCADLQVVIYIIMSQKHFWTYVQFWSITELWAFKNMDIVFVLQWEITGKGTEFTNTTDQTVHVRRLKRKQWLQFFFRACDVAFKM
jgi:hypothetical protein